MLTPTITIDGVTYIAPAPRMGLWRKLQKFKTERRKQAEMLKVDWEMIESAKDDTEQLEPLLNELNAKLEINRQFSADGMLDIILTAFPDMKNTDDILIQDVPATYELIKTWLQLIMTGRLAELPNAETPAEN